MGQALRIVINTVQTTSTLNASSAVASRFGSATEIPTTVTLATCERVEMKRKTALETIKKKVVR